jgi:hypothetical protein
LVNCGFNLIKELVGIAIVWRTCHLGVVWQSFQTQRVWLGFHLGFV